jgi:hypothetical protein
MKIRAEINEIETKINIQRINEAELVLWKDMHEWQTLSQTSQKILEDPE